MNGDAIEPIAKMSLHSTAGAGADLGAAACPNPDASVRANGNTCHDAFPLGEFLAKQPDVDGLGKSGSAHLDVATIGYSEEFTRLISAQKIHTPPSNIIAKADQCLKN